MPAKRLSLIFLGVLLFGALSWGQGCSNLGDYTDASTQPSVTTSYSPTPSVTLPNPIHHWGFENTGTDDGTTGGWNGTLMGAASYTSSVAQVKVGSYALSLTGTTGDAFSLSSVTVPTLMTFACWVQWSSGSLVASNTIFANSTSPAGGGSNQSGFRLYVIESTGQVVFETSDGTTIVQTTSSSNLASGTYTHVAVTVDSTNNQDSIYLNGDSSSGTGVTQANFGLTGGAFIGSMPSSEAPFNGQLDDCRVYDQLLSSAQIQLLYSGTQ